MILKQYEQDVWGLVGEGKYIFISTPSFPTFDRVLGAVFPDTQHLAGDCSSQKQKIRFESGRYFVAMMYSSTVVIVFPLMTEHPLLIAPITPYFDQKIKFFVPFHLHFFSYNASILFFSMSFDLSQLESADLVQIIDWVKSGVVSSQEVYLYFLQKTQELNPKLNAFIEIYDTQRMADVDTLLAGLPLGIKDVFNEKGKLTQAASKMLEGYIAPYDATTILKLNKAGMSSLGTLNMDEFAMGGSGERSAFGPALNPHDITRVPGGSSSGSAVAVAAGMVPAALGTDTGGSIRQPASMCGVVGFKPTYGRNSRYGVMAMASSLDTPGTITRSVRDAYCLYSIMAGHDPLDTTSLSVDVPLDSSVLSTTSLVGKKIGIPKEYFVDGLDPGVKASIDQAIDHIKALGAEIVEVSLPHTHYGISVYYIIMSAEVSTNMARYDGIRFGHKEGAGNDVKLNRSTGFGPEVLRRVMLGSHVLSAGFYDAYYRKASEVRELIRQDFDRAFHSCDIIVTPVSPSVAWKIGEKVSDPLKMYLADVFTIPASLAGLPGMSLPIDPALPEDGTTKALPVGLHILAKPQNELEIFRVASALERVYITH